MTTLNIPSIFMPLVGLIFSVMGMAFVFLHIQKNEIF